MVVKPKNNSDIHQNIKHMFVNIIISKLKKSLLINHDQRDCPFTKLGKINRQQPGVKNGTLDTTSPTYNRNDNSNKKINVSGKYSITPEAHSIPSNYVIHTTDDLIKTKPVSIPHTNIMLGTYVTVDEKSQYFSTPRKHIHSYTAPINKVPLGYDTTQYKKISQLT